MSSRIAEEAARHAATFRRDFDRQLETLIPIRSLYFALRGMQPYDFQNVVNALMVQHPDIRALVWFRKDSARGKDASPFDERIATGQMDWDGETYKYYLDYYTGPSGANGPTLFFGLSPKSSLRTGLLRARDAGMSIDTEGVELIEATEDPGSYAILLPIFDPNAGKRPGRGDLLGFLVGIYRAGSAGRDSGIIPGDREASVTLHDVTDPRRPILVFTNGSRNAGFPIGEGGKASRVERFEAGGRSFALSFMPAEGFFKANGSHVPWLVLAGGTILSLMYGTYLHLSERRAAEACRLLDERTRSERNFRLALDGFPFPIVIFGESNGIFFMNRQFSLLTGYEPGRFADSDALLSAMLRVPDRLSPFRTKVRGMTPDRPSADHGTVPVTTADLETRTWEIRTSRVETWDDRNAIMLAGNDVTDKAILERQMARSQKLDAIGRLAGGISHDLNNLLGAISGHAEVARLRHAGNDDVSARMGSILDICGRGAALIRQLLAYSRQQPRRPEVVHVDRVLEGTHAMLRRLVGDHIDLATHPGDDTGCVLMDPSQLEQIVVNLVVNARDAVPDGGHIAVETRRLVADDEYARRLPSVGPGDYVVLAVSDDGEGIPESIRDRIFDPYFTTKQARGGNGLGLSTVYGIVKQNGGFVRVDSQEGRGTTFQVWLPACEPAGIPAECARKDPDSLFSFRGTERVLLVEDDDDLRETTEALLRGLGYAVVPAASGEDAVRAVEEFGTPIDLLLADVILPRMNGREAASRLEAIKGRPLPTIYMSGYADAVIERHGILPERSAFLRKPFSSEELGRKVRETLDAGEPTAA